MDLRDNPGGIVGAGLDVAAQFLPEGEVFCVISDRTGEEMTVRVEAPLRGTVTNTTTPLAVLVNRGSASTSELVAGSLRDSGRATLVGETTFGKGRTQTVFNLQDGSSLLVTTARYETPKRARVDRVGLPPDVVCIPELVVDGGWTGGSGDDATRDSLLDDPCIVVAEKEVVKALKGKVER